MSEFEINIKMPARADTLVVNITSADTVLQVKQKVAVVSGTPAESQRLIFAGRVLKDDQIVSECKIDKGVTVHMVPIQNRAAPRAAAAAAAPTTNFQPAQPQAQPQNPFAQPQQAQNPFASMFGGQGGLGGLGNMFGAGGGGNIMQQAQQMMQNPDFMRQMMESPMMQQLNQQLLNNPEVLQGFISNNPQVQELINRNPEIGHVLRDPAMLRQAMQMSQNPELMREMMRSSDRTLTNIENMPGGFDMIRRHYENVVEPLHQATQMPAPVESNTSNQSAEPVSATPNTNPLPNPWAGNAPAAGGAANPMPNLFGSGMNMNNLFGASAGTGAGATGEQTNANANPFGIDMNNPMFQSFFNMMMNPQQNAGQQTGAAGQPNTNPFGNLDFGSLMNMFGGANANAFGAAPQTGASTATAQPQQSPEARFAVQLQQLNDMGFNDQAANIRCLLATGGNVNLALEQLLRGD